MANDTRKTVGKTPGADDSRRKQGLPPNSFDAQPQQHQDKQSKSKGR